MADQLEKTFRRGEVIIKEGHQGSTFYVILDGMVEVLKRRGEEDVVLSVLGPGEFFGELSLIDPELPKRSATVRAVEKTRVLIMSKEAFENYLGKLSPGVRNLLAKLATRLREAIAQGEAQKRKDGHLATEPENFDFTMTLDELEQARKTSVNVNYLVKKFRLGQTVLRQGEKGQCGFIVRKGKLEVSRVVEDRKVVLNVLEPHDILGENALFEDSHRTATVRALTDGELLVFGKRDMLSMARKSPVELFMIMDSMSAKLDRTNENYCKALIDLEKNKHSTAALEARVSELTQRLEELEAENAGLKRNLEPSGGSGNARPA